jgi:hypothetical protein
VTRVTQNPRRSVVSEPTAEPIAVPDVLSAEIEGALPAADSVDDDPFIVEGSIAGLFGVF